MIQTMVCLRPQVRIILLNKDWLLLLHLNANGMDWGSQCVLRRISEEDLAFLLFEEVLQAVERGLQRCFSHLQPAIAR